MSTDKPDWVDHAIWWHVYPLGFTGADPTGTDRSPAGGLDRITAWLEYAVELGTNGLALGPVFESGSHGYDTIDHYRIDSRLGDRAVFDRLVGAAHDRGLRVMLDGVFNHVGTGFVTDERKDWLRGGRHATFEGHEGLLALDHRNPAVADHVADVMTHWLDAGVDAWRLDAAYAVEPEFWTTVLQRVRAAHPDAYVVGEMLHGDYADYVSRSGVDAVTQYELWKAIWSSLTSGNFFELDHALRRHNGFLDTFVPFTFVGNHDVTRIATQIADPRHRPHALALLMTLGGTPAVYYGDEVGALAVKEDRVGGDDAIRPAFPSERGGEFAFDTAESDDTLRQHQALIGLRRRHPWLHRARTETVHLTNESIVLRMTAEQNSLVLALNLADDDLDVEGVHVSPHGWTVLE